jgi:hypothetical protein
MDIVENAAGNADDEDFKFSPRFVFNASGNINNDAFVDFDFFIVEEHFALAIDDVIELIRFFVVMEFRVGDFDFADFTGGFVFGFDQKADLAAGLGPRLDGGGVAPKIIRLSGGHGRSLRL